MSNENVRESAKTLLIATGNRDKAGEIKTILQAGLSDLGVEILVWADLPGAQEPEETGSTYAQNATIKAEAACEQTRLISLGDDVGLEIDALDGQPGLYSKRFAGEQTPFSKKIELILQKLEGLPVEKRGCRFRAAVAICAPGLETRVFEASKEGQVAFAPSGARGFGYDPIFYLPEQAQSMAELPSEVKNRISHRAQVLESALPFLRELFQN